MLSSIIITSWSFHYWYGFWYCFFLERWLRSYHVDWRLAVAEWEDLKVGVEAPYCHVVPDPSELWLLAGAVVLVSAEPPVTPTFNKFILDGTTGAIASRTGMTTGILARASFLAAIYLKTNFASSSFQIFWTSSFVLTSLYTSLFASGHSFALLFSWSTSSLTRPYCSSLSLESRTKLVTNSSQRDLSLLTCRIKSSFSFL